MWYSYAVGQGTAEMPTDIAVIEDLTSTLSTHEDIFTFSIVVTVFSLFMICFAIAAIKRARLAARLFAEAGKVRVSLTCKNLS